MSTGRKRFLWIGGASALAAAVAVTLVVLAAGPATAEQFATLHPLEGTVEVSRDGSSFSPGTEGQNLQEGFTVRTGSDGRAEIEYFDGSVTRLDNGTTFKLTELSSDPNVDGSKEIEGSQTSGRTFNRVVSLTDSESRFDVTTPNATASVQGTRFVTIVHPDGSTEHWVLEGRLVLSNDSGDEVAVEAGFGIVVDPEGAMSDPFVLTDEQLNQLCGFVEAGQACEETVVEGEVVERKIERDPPEDPPVEQADPVVLAIVETPPDEEEPQQVVIDVPIPSAPNTVITSGPAARVGSSTARFAFGSNKSGSSFKCSLDGSAFGPCGSPKTYTNLSDGPHTFAVRAVFQGVTDPTPATWSWTIDTIGPDTQITSGPNGNTTDTTATFTFVSSEPNSTFRCRLDGGAFQPCSSGIVYTGLSAGGHTFAVQAVDGVGNPDPTPDTWSWTIVIEGADPTNHPPVASRPDNVFTTAGTSVSFALVANDPDPEDRPNLTFHIVSPPQNGTLSGQAPNLTYTPDPGFVGTDSFTWKANDGKVDSNIATTRIRVRPGGGAQGSAGEAAAITSERVAVNDERGSERSGDEPVAGGDPVPDPEPSPGPQPGPSPSPTPGPSPSPTPDPSPSPSPEPAAPPPGGGNGNGNANAGGGGNGNGNGNGNGKS